MFFEVLNLSMEKSPVRISRMNMDTKTDFFADKKGKIKNIDFHSHDEMEILYIKNGTFKCKTTDGTLNILKKGDMVLFKGGVLHSTSYNIDEIDYYNLQFSLKHFFDILNSFLGKYIFYNAKNYALLNDKEDIGKKISEIISDVYLINNNKQKGSDEIIVGKICELIGVLIGEEIITVLDKDNDKMVDAIVSTIVFINNNYGERITPKEIAENVNFNSDYLGRIFKKNTGNTLMEYLNIVRLNEAKKMLVSTDKSITEIANETGFSSVSYFVRAFKNSNLITPSEYRKVKLVGEKFKTIAY